MTNGSVDAARIHVPPLASYVIVAMRTLNTLAKKGDITPDDIRHGTDDVEALLAAFPGYPGPRAQREGE